MNIVEDGIYTKKIKLVPKQSKSSYKGELILIRSIFCLEMIKLNI